MAQITELNEEVAKWGVRIVSLVGDGADAVLATLETDPQGGDVCGAFAVGNTVSGKTLRAGVAAAAAAVIRPTIFNHHVLVEVDGGTTALPPSCTAAPARRARPLLLAVVMHLAVTLLPMVSGDPYTGYGGKRTQFYLPAQKLVRLATCAGLEIEGSVMPSRLAGDASQWFDSFRVSLGGEEVLRVAVSHASPLPAPAPAISGRAADAADVSVETQARAAAGAEEGFGESRAGLPLTTLNASVAGHRAPSTAARVAAPGGAEVSLLRHSDARIGGGWVERAAVDAPGVALQITSAAAGKFANAADRVRHAHLDMRVRRLDARYEKYCEGPLPEMWGLRPMTAETARLLQPPQ